MALVDVKAYLKQIEDVRYEAKEDLADFDEALKNGYITEDKLKEVKKDFELIDANYQRLLYIMWLLNIPARRSKRARFDKESAKLIKQFSLVKSDKEAVLLESKDALAKLRAELKKLKS